MWRRACRDKLDAHDYKTFLQTNISKYSLGKPGHNRHKFALKHNVFDLRWKNSFWSHCTAFDIMLWAEIYTQVDHVHYLHQYSMLLSLVLTRSSFALENMYFYVSLFIYPFSTSFHMSTPSWQFNLSFDSKGATFNRPCISDRLTLSSVFIFSIQSYIALSKGVALLLSAEVNIY